MSPKNKTLRNTIGAFRVDDDLLAALEAEQGKSFGDSMAGTVERLLRERLADPNAGPVVMTAADELKMRRLTAEVSERERKNKEASGELIEKEKALAELDKDYAEVRQRIEQINVDGLTDEQRDQLEKSKQDCFVDLSGGGPANEFG